MEYTDIKIYKVGVVKAYSIEIVFNDGKVKQVNLEPVLRGNLFGQLLNLELFRQVRVNEEINTIEWPNGADFHPETLYNWEIHKDELTLIAKKWAQQKKTA